MAPGAGIELTAQTVLRNYFHAKDENRPHLLQSVFDPDAELLMVNHTNAISFPARTVGREAIADVLVRDFGRTYENIYSIYLAKPDGSTTAFSCGWLVAMSEKQSKSARVGCGRYDWSFGAPPQRLATRLTVTIDVMLVMPADELGTVLSWVEGLNYPWSSAEEAVLGAPRIALLAPVLLWLTSRGTAGASAS
ncbi:MAG: hypothetical protein V4792_03040 [Pseudomonadota bacterium]